MKCSISGCARIANMTGASLIASGRVPKTLSARMKFSLQKELGGHRSRCDALLPVMHFAQEAIEHQERPKNHAVVRTAGIMCIHQPGDLAQIENAAVGH